MALANFYPRSATAASQVLRGFDAKVFESKLAQHAVGVALDGAAAQSREARKSLELAINLLARFYPCLVLLPLDRKAASLRDSLEKQARRINPLITIRSARRGVSKWIAVGETQLKLDGVILYVGSQEWTAALSSDGPIGSGTTSNPFGAGAACFAVANIFRSVFSDQLVRSALDSSLKMSMFDFSVGDAIKRNPVLSEVSIGAAFLVGLGAIGNGAVWALARTPKVRGKLTLIDHQAVEISNLQRYVLATQRDVNKRKVDLAANALSRSKLRISKHHQTWEQFIDKRQDWNLERVIVALDTARDRLAVQGSLPKWIANSWTQPGDIGVSRHHFLNPSACLACLYLPNGPAKNEDELIAAALGLSQQVLEVRRLLHTGAGLARSFIQQIANALNVPAEPLYEFEGQSLRSFYTQAVCGGIFLKLEGEQRAVDAEVPMAFQSAVAGLMLAAELVKEGAGISPDIGATTKIDLLRRLTPYLSERRMKSPMRKCICQDEDFRRAYKLKYL
jgi:molybdopterin/thiamine biosynthesis adenylyltransferase